MDAETLMMVEKMIKDAIKEERKRIAQVVRNAKEVARDYYDQRMSFTGTLEKLSYEIDPSSKPDWETE
jgi:hypothetical protein